MARVNPFPIPDLEPGGGFATGCKSGCGHDHSEEGFYTRIVRKSLKSLALTARVALKDIDPLSGMETDPLATDDPDEEDQETGAGAWLALELALAALLARKYYELSQRTIIIYLQPYFTPEGEWFDDAGFHTAATQADQAMRAATAEELAEEVKAHIRQTLFAGEAEVQAGILGTSRAARMEQAVENLTQSTMHYVDEFFTGHILPAIEREIVATLGEGPLARPNLQPILETLKERLQAEPYMNIVANATASRSFHYGYLSAAQAQGYLTVVFQAVIDERTSEICFHLHGSRWQLADMLQKYEQSVSAQNTDELKIVAPWFRRTKGKPLDKDVEEFLIQAGVPVPPLHGLCRSTLLVM